MWKKQVFHNLIYTLQIHLFTSCETRMSSLQWIRCFFSDQNLSKIPLWDNHKIHCLRRYKELRNSAYLDLYITGFPLNSINTCFEIITISQGNNSLFYQREKYISTTFKNTAAEKRARISNPVKNRVLESYSNIFFTLKLNTEV